MAHQEFGTDLLNKVKEDLADIAQVESFPKLEGSPDDYGSGS